LKISKIRHEEIHEKQCSVLIVFTSHQSCSP